MEYLAKMAPAEHCYQLEVLQAERPPVGSVREFTGRLKAELSTLDSMILYFNVNHMLLTIGKDRNMANFHIHPCFAKKEADIVQRLCVRLLVSHML